MLTKPLLIATIATGQSVAAFSPQVSADPVGGAIVGGAIGAAVGGPPGAARWRDPRHGYWHRYGLPWASLRVWSGAVLRPAIRCAAAPLRAAATLLLQAGARVLRPTGCVCAACRYCGRIPDDFITEVHRPISLLMNARNCSGVVGAGSAPCPDMRSRVSGASSARTSVRLSVVTIGAGVPAGARTPYQSVSSYPGTPASAMVGSSGNTGARVALVTPKARSLRDRMCGATPGTPPNNIDICPPRSSINAAPTPDLYGTCTISIFASDFRSSAER